MNVEINPEALHQGLFLFKKVLRRLGHEIIPMPGKNDEMQITGFMEFIEGVVRSFIGTGCMPIHSDDPTIIEFQPYPKHKMSGTFDIAAQTSTSTETNEGLEAMHNMLDYDSDDDASDAMNYILDHEFDSSLLIK